MNAMTGKDESPTRTLTELRNEALKTAKDHGFKDASIPEDCALMHSEITEMLEDFRARRLPHELLYERKLELPRTVIDGIETFLKSHGFEMPPEARFITVTTKEKATKAPDGRVVLNKPVGIPSELADVIVRILHFSGKWGVDIERAVIEKMAFNQTRPFKHGDKAI